MATPIIGAVANVNYNVEATWGTPVTTNLKPFGANVKVGNMATENQLTLKGGLGSALPQANIPGAYTNSFSLEFDIEQASSSIRWLASLLGPSQSATIWSYPYFTNANAPTPLTIVFGANTDTVDAHAETTHIFTGCYCTSARFEAAVNEAIHVSADFIGKSVTIDEANSSGTITMKMSSQSIFNFTQAVLTGTGFTTGGVVERFTINIGREANYKHGIGTRLPQAIVTGLCSFGMDATIMYETGGKVLNSALGATNTATTPSSTALTDAALVLTVTDGSNVLTFTGSTQYYSKVNLTADINDAVMMDVSSQGKLIVVALTGVSA